ncbi:MAG TPA: hypothetical protein VIJ19_02525 [Opitutaceae bacterium]
MNSGNPNNAKLAKQKLSNPQRGIVPPKPAARRGPQVPKSSKRP